MSYDDWEEDYARNDECGKCGEEIVFLKNKNSKWVPIDAETISPGDSQFEPKSGHVLHFDTCRERARQSALDDFAGV